MYPIILTIICHTFLCLRIETSFELQVDKIMILSLQNIPFNVLQDGWLLIKNAFSGSLVKPSLRLQYIKNDLSKPAIHLHQQCLIDVTEPICSQVISEMATMNFMRLAINIHDISVKVDAMRHGNNLGMLYLFA